MTAKELAEMLSGREVGNEIGGPVVQWAKESGLVVIYGYSDDNVELRGAIDEEVGAWDGATIHITPDGLLEEPTCSDAENCTCPYFTAAKSAAKTIKAIWHDEGGPCWTFETDIPHETFTVMEDGEPFCVGIVFSMEELERGIGDMPTITPPPNAPLTLEELREMDGEPVWVIPFGGSSTAQYAIVNVEKERLCVSDGDYSPFGDYGRYVLACRRKPEEGKKN